MPVRSNSPPSVGKSKNPVAKGGVKVGGLPRMKLAPLGGEEAGGRKIFGCVSGKKHLLFVLSCGKR